jgi:electron transport complex protein RnfG
MARSGAGTYFGSTLAAFQVNLKDRITANKLNETLVRIPGLFWGADQARKMEGQNATVDIIPGTLEIQAKDKKTNHPLFRVDLEGQLAGWVIRTGGQGYADNF